MLALRHSIVGWGSFRRAARFNVEIVSRNVSITSLPRILRGEAHSKRGLKRSDKVL